MARTTLLLLMLIGFIGTASSAIVWRRYMHQYAVAEDAKRNDIVYTLKAEDVVNGVVNTLSTILYGVRGVGSIPFLVNATSGDVIVYLPRLLDRELNKEVTITFVAYIAGTTNEESEIKATVVIKDVNDNAPQFQQTTYSTTLDENVPVGTIVISSMSVSDLDVTINNPSNQIEVSCNETIAAEKFLQNVCDIFSVTRIRSSSTDWLGRIILSQPLDYEAVRAGSRNSYRIPLTATDGIHWTDQSVEVFVNDVQDTPPIFIRAGPTFVVNESYPAMQRIDYVKAVDQDLGSPREIYYEIISNPGNVFNIDSRSGYIWPTMELDLDNPVIQPTMNIVLKAREILNTTTLTLGDDALTTATSSIQVVIRDINDNKPSFEFSEYRTKIYEDIADNTALPNIRILVNDKDSILNNKYAVLLDFTDVFKLADTATTGTGKSTITVLVKNTTLIDYEKGPRNYTLRIVAQETDTLEHYSSSAMVYVEILDVNDNSPQFSQPSYVVSLPESTPVGTLVTTVTATDIDSGLFGTDGIRYELVGPGNDRFQINPIIGLVTVKSCFEPSTVVGCLDYEAVSSYQFTVIARDNGGTGIPVLVDLKINIIDENDNAPVFGPKSYSSYIKEGDLIPFPTVVIKATDRDKVGGPLSFTFITEDVPGLWRIDRLGNITASRPIKYEDTLQMKGFFMMTVQITDGKYYDTATVRIDVLKSVSCVTETDWNLTVEYPVDIMIINAGNIYNGSSVNITCMIRVVKNVTPTITWKYDGTVVKPVTGSRISISNITVDPETPQRISQTMSFNPIQSSDSGTYECVVMDDNLPPSVKNMTVIVLSQPEVFIKPVTQTVDAGFTVNITCEVKHNVQITRMFWYRNGTNINSTNKLSEETFLNDTTTNIHVLTHRNIKYTTRYECRGENDAGQGNMQQAIIYVVLPGSQPGETCKTENDTRGTEWSRTLQDTYDKKPCPTEMSGEAVRYCLHGGVWSNPSYDNCIKNTLLDLQKLIDKIKNGLAPNIVPDALVNLTGLTNPNTVELHKAEVQVVSSILNDVIQISNNTNITNNDVENFLEIASNLIDVKNSPAWQALIIEGNKGATTVLQNVEEYNRIKAKSINSADEPVKRFTRKNLFVEIGYNPVSDIQFPNTTANGSAFINGSSIRFVFSRDALNNGNYTSYSCAYFNNVSGLIKRYVLQNGSKTNTGADLEINSAVLSLQLDPHPPPLLSPPLILTFKHFSANYSKPVCSYWVFIAPGSGNGTWSNNGCKVVSTSDYTTVCECNHLTNFAILMSPGKTPDKAQVPLSIISIIGCAISIFCLSVTMIAHFIVWRYVKSDRTSLLMNLCLALIISYIIFLAGVDRTENKGVCIAVAALLHYFYLTVFFLMLTYGIELAVSVINVFVTRSRIQWLLPLAWSLPAVVVAISLGVTKLDGYGNEKFCWLSIKDGLIWAFVGPAALVTLVNFIIILVVFKHMFSSFTMMAKSDKDKAKTAVRSLCVLLPITGITWVFGILSVNEDLVVFQYLFAIINSLQGLFISLFHCFFNHNLRQAIKQINAKRKRSLVTYSTTPKISSNSSGQIKDREERHEMIRAVPVNQEDQMIITREERDEMIRAVPVNQEDQMIITRYDSVPELRKRFLSSGDILYLGVHSSLLPIILSSQYVFMRTIRISSHEISHKSWCRQEHE